MDSLEQYNTGIFTQKHRQEPKRGNGKTKPPILNKGDEFQNCLNFHAKIGIIFI